MNLASSFKDILLSQKKKKEKEINKPQKVNGPG